MLCPFIVVWVSYTVLFYVSLCVCMCACVIESSTRTSQVEGSIERERERLRGHSLITNSIPCATLLNEDVCIDSTRFSTIRKS